MSWEMFPEPGEGAIGFAVIGTGMVCLGLLFLGWFVWVCCYWVDLSGFAEPGLICLGLLFLGWFLGFFGTKNMLWSIIQKE